MTYSDSGRPGVRVDGRLEGGARDTYVSHDMYIYIHIYIYMYDKHI